MNVFGVVKLDVKTAFTSPIRSQYQSMVNNLPANGEIVNLNPPQFQWCYTTNFTSLATDAECKTFVFECAYDSNFINLAVNKTTVWNFYNTIAPFTNNGPIYWRVGYVHGITQIAGVITPSNTNGNIYC